MIAATTDTTVYLVRYGKFPEVARFALATAEQPERGATVVVETDRGLQTGTVLECLQPSFDPMKESDTEFKLIRIASPMDLDAAHKLTQESETQFVEWCARISQWGLNLELVDLEWTLDRQKLILYVLCDRGPDTTKLALQAAASGFGIIEVQPVSANGLVAIPQSGCGSGGGGCGCEH
jgi:cell fate regulator YaaT (PSP1 superfamily)